MKNLLISTLILLVLIVPVFLMSNEAQSSEPETGCGYPPLDEEPPLGRRNTWTQNATIKVFIAEAFTDDQEKGIKEALANFQNAKTTNTSEVSFDIIIGDPPANPSYSYCQFKKRVPPSGEVVQ